MTHRGYRHSRSRRHKHRHRHRHNIVNKTLDKSVSVVKSTSRKYMPKVKSGLENVGSKVIKTSKESVPFLKRMTRKLFGTFSSSKKRGQH